jgi:general stress protein CsbA
VRKNIGDVVVKVVMNIIFPLSLIIVFSTSKSITLSKYLFISFIIINIKKPSSRGVGVI